MHLRSLSVVVPRLLSDCNPAEAGLAVWREDRYQNFNLCLIHYEFTILSFELINAISPVDFIISDNCLDVIADQNYCNHDYGK